MGRWAHGSDRTDRGDSADADSGSGVGLGGQDCGPAGKQDRAGPVEEPAGVAGGEVHAAVALPSAEVVVPKGGVEPVAALEVLDPRDAFDGVVALDVLALEVVHGRGRELDPDPELADRCAVGGAKIGRAPCRERVE